MTAFASLLPLLIFPALVVVAAVRDATTFTIPNWISLSAAAAFLPAALLSGAPLTPVGVALATGALALVVGVVMFSLGWIGGGDAKLFAASALWLGWPAVLPFLFWTSAAGGGLAVLLLWGRSLARYYPGAGPPWFARLMQPGGDVPYGVAIAIGALAAFPSSVLLHLRP